MPTVFLKTLVADVRSGKAKDMLAAGPMAAPAAVPTRRAGVLGYTLIIDNSTTLKKQFAFVKRVTRSLVEQNVGNDGAKVVSFGWRGERQIERFETDRRKLLSSVEAIEAHGDRWTSPVIDSLYWTLEKVRPEERPVETDNGIVVLTHGMDGVSEKTWDELTEFARAHKVPVYCVLFAPDSRRTGPPSPTRPKDSTGSKRGWSDRGRVSRPCAL